MMTINMLNGHKLIVLVDRNDLPLAYTVSPVNVHGSRLYTPTLEAFKTRYAGSSYYTREIRQYNRKRKIKSNILVCQRSRRQSKRGRPVWLDLEL